MLTPRLRSITLPDASQPTHCATLTYAEWGEETARPPLICVHGLTRNGRDFDFLARQIARSRRVLCPDMPGRGLSPRLKNTQGYAYPAYTANMLAFVKQLGIQRPHWIGTSMGGVIGMMLAGAQPGILRSLVLNDIGQFIPATGLKRILTYAGNGAFASREEAETALRQRCAPFGIDSEEHWFHLLHHGVQELADGGFGFTCDPAILEALPKPEDAKDVDLRELWSKLGSLPVLLVRGAQSDILTREVARAMQEGHPRLEYFEVTNAGHAPALMAQPQIERIQMWLDARDSDSQE